MKSLCKFLFFCLCLSTLSQKISANHAMAVDLSYACLNETDQSYTLTLDFYFDCGSEIIQIPPNSVIINAVSQSCGEALTIELVRDSNIGGEEVSQLCDSILENDESNCGQGIFPGVEKYVFEGIVTLPQKCSDWVFSYRLSDLEFRSATITNISNPDLKKLYVQATLDNTEGCNSAPSFTHIPVAYFCTQSSTFTQGAIETDGDELNFSLVNPLHDFDSPLLYVNGNTPSNPFPNEIFNFDGQTGEIQFKTNVTQRPVVAVLVEEYRDGQLIGSVMRDMQFVILECDNKSVESNLIPEQSQFSICPDENIHLDFGFEDSNAEDVITITAVNIEGFNGANFTQATDTSNPAMASFDWTPTLGDEGLYILEVEVSDNYCPIPSKLLYTYAIEVISSPICGTDIESSPQILTRFYPNPFTDFLQIDFVNPPGLPNHIAVYDTKGMLIYEKSFDSQTSNYSISTTDWQQGLYLCKVTYAERIFVEKVSKW